MNIQLELFLRRFPIEKLKKGVECDCCGHTFKAFGYELDKRFVALAYKIMDYCLENRTKEWDRHDVFGDDVVAQKIFYQLAFFGIIESTKQQNIYRLTRTGHDWLMGNITLPSKVWIHDWRRWKKPILEEDHRISVLEAEPRWKFLTSHWTMDYVLYNHYSQQRLPV